MEKVWVGVLRPQWSPSAFLGWHLGRLEGVGNCVVGIHGAEEHSIQKGWSKVQKA